MSKARPHVYFHSSMDSAAEWREALQSEFADLEFSAGEEVPEPGTVDVALVWTLPESGLMRFTNLRAIQSLGAGVNQLDPHRLPPGVPIARLVDGSLTRMMVDYAKTAVFRHHRKFHLFERRSRERSWTYVLPTLTDTTSVGVLGLGELGNEIALALSREGFATFGWSRTPKNLSGVKSYTGRDGLLSMVAQCDIILNVLPLTGETRHILSRELFCHFRRGACLINMGRGMHLNEQDLLDAIRTGIIEAATLDVCTVEPLPETHPFWNHDDILITPHVAGTSIPLRAVTGVAENIRRALSGQRLLQQVDPLRGY